MDGSGWTFLSLLSACLLGLNLIRPNSIVNFDSLTLLSTQPCCAVSTAHLTDGEIKAQLMQTNEQIKRWMSCSKAGRFTEAPPVPTRAVWQGGLGGTGGLLLDTSVLSPREPRPLLAESCQPVTVTGCPSAPLAMRLWSRTWASTHSGKQDGGGSLNHPLFCSCARLDLERTQRSLRKRWLQYQKHS